MFAEIVFYRRSECLLSKKEKFQNYLLCSEKYIPETMGADMVQKVIVFHESGRIFYGEFFSGLPKFFQMYKIFFDHLSKIM